MTKYTSDFIFSLADKYQIPFDESKQTEFLDESYFSFSKEYLEQCESRDVNLKHHLTNKPNLFRTFLPWRADAFETVFQTQWYYDELIIYDPIFFEIKHFKSDNNEENKTRLRQLLSFLFSLKESIKGGFLLFGSYDTFATTNQEFEDNKFENLLSIPEIREECDRLVKVYKMVSAEGNEKSYFQIRSYYRSKQTFFSIIKDTEKIKSEQGFEINYDFINSKYIPLSIEETKHEGFYDRIYNGFKDDYPLEIKEVLNYIDIGSSIKTPVLFNRKLDELVLSNISTNEKIIKSKANDYYKLFLPFVNNIPAERLFDVREKMPTAFFDFRNLMFEIIYDYEKSGVDADILQLKIQQKVNPLLRKLESEMRNSLTKAKVIGVGLPIITGVGALGLWSYGIDISKYATLLGGLSVAGELNTLTNYLTEKRTGKTNTLYYLWEIQQK